MAWPTYEDVIDRIAMFPEGSDAEALHRHFVREIDQGNYDFALIERTRQHVAAHARQALDRGDIVTTAGLRLQKAAPLAGREALAKASA